jgi:hypothetical protein
MVVYGFITLTATEDCEVITLPLFGNPAPVLEAGNPNPGIEFGSGVALGNQPA